jgi:hypothetical protein
MAPVPTPPLPGSMTVPPLFGWEDILTVLAVLIALAVVFFLASAAGRSADSRSEWQAGLQARSREHRHPDDGSVDGPVERLRTDPLA